MIMCHPSPSINIYFSITILFMDAGNPTSLFEEIKNKPIILPEGTDPVLASLLNSLLEKVVRIFITHTLDTAIIDHHQCLGLYVSYIYRGCHEAPLGGALS